MVLNLILSIISSALLFVILKKFKDWNVETIHGILVNYFMASLLSILFSDIKFDQTLPPSKWTTGSLGGKTSAMSVQESEIAAQYFL